MKSGILESQFIQARGLKTQLENMSEMTSWCQTVVLEICPTAVLVPGHANMLLLYHSVWKYMQARHMQGVIQIINLVGRKSLTYLAFEFNIICKLYHTANQLRI